MIPTTTNNAENPPFEIKGFFDAAIKNPQNELINRVPKKRGQRAWTDAQRAQAAVRARLNKPWKHSTGPKTVNGKTRSSKNAITHGLHTRAHRVIAWWMREQARFVRSVNRYVLACRAARRFGLKEPEFSFAPVSFECYQGRLFSLNKTKTRSEKCPRS